MSPISDGIFVARPDYFAGLRALGVEREDITDVVCTHLHADHIGWLFDLEARPHFPRATIWFEAGDWRYFIEERHGPPIQDHARQGFRGHLALHRRRRPRPRQPDPRAPLARARRRERQRAGAHFPELKFGRVLEGSGRRWWT